MPGRLARLVRARQTGGLAKRARAEWDYLSFVLTRIWPLVVGFAGVLAAVVTLAPSQWALVVSVIALVAGFGMFVRDVVLARRQWSRLQCVAVVSPFPVADVQPPLGYEERLTWLFRIAAPCWCIRMPIG